MKATGRYMLSQYRSIPYLSRTCLGVISFFLSHAAGISYLLQFKLGFAIISQNRHSSQYNAAGGDTDSS